MSLQISFEPAKVQSTRYKLGMLKNQVTVAEKQVNPAMYFLSAINEPPYMANKLTQQNAEPRRNGKKSPGTRYVATATTL